VTLSEPAQVHLGSHQRPTQLIVKFPRQRGLLCFRHVLKIRRQLRQFGRACINCTLQLLRLFAQRLIEPVLLGQVVSDQQSGEHQQQDGRRGPATCKPSGQQNLVLPTRGGLVDRSLLAFDEPGDQAPQARH